jgi:hypothetical protein
MNLRISNYAPVSMTEIDHDKLSLGVLQGYAAPERGPKPCRLELVCGGKLVAIADASGFSKTAHAKGVRFGWCRFDMNGLTLTGALDEVAELRCIISGRVVHDFRAKSFASSFPVRKPLALSAFRTLIGELHGCSSLEQIAPFTERYRELHGDRAFLEALYLYLHTRKVSGIEVDSFLRHLPEKWTVADCWHIITSSDEFVRCQRYALPGIFASGFTFGLELLG